jgi:predicted amidophosphoribosyltransferase
MTPASGFLLGLLCPARCASCGADGALACERCLAALAAPPRPVRPTPCPAGFPATYAVADYGGPCRDLILAYKDRGAVGLCGKLAEALAVALLAAAAAARGREPVIVPVPSSPAAIRERGDDVMLLLARRAAALARPTLGRVRVVPALRQRRPVADSVGLGAAARAANLDRALAVRPRALPRLIGHPAVLVDDLVTTGATLAEASRALGEAGGCVIGAAAVAATRRHDRWQPH